MVIQKFRKRFTIDQITRVYWDPLYGLIEVKDYVFCESLEYNSWTPVYSILHRLGVMFELRETKFSDIKNSTTNIRREKEN